MSSGGRARGRQPIRRAPFPGSTASRSSAPAASSTASTAGTCGVFQPASAAASWATRSRAGLAFSTAGPPSAVRQRMTTDTLPRWITVPYSMSQRSARSLRTAGSASNHASIALPDRRPRRRRSSSSTSGMLDVAIASQVSRRAAVPPAARRETGLDDALVRACASPPRTTKSLEVVPQREHGGSHESNHKHDHSPPRFQATCHPVRKIPPADPPRLRASTTSARRAAAPPCDGDGHGR